LGQNLSPADAQAIALEEYRSAYQQWFAGRDALFADLVSQADAIVGKMRARAQITGADYQTDAGRQLLEQHFPEKKWRRKTSSVGYALVALGLLAAACLGVGLAVPEPGPVVGFGLVAALIGLFAVTYGWRHRSGALTLTADGLHYSGWRRRLAFKDVRKLLLQQDPSSVTLHFLLKHRQPSVWKYSWLPVPRKKISLSLRGFDEPPRPMAQTIFRYFTRQTEPALVTVPVPSISFH
jgi:hypothetical protein